MSNRHLSRTIALQTFFEWDFYHRSKKLFDILERNQADFAPDFDDGGFTQDLVKGITKHLPDIDETIQKFAPEWPLDQITLIDRNILRIGTYELEYAKEVPPKVSINESIELAKTFGGPASHRFVNGVLGSIYKDLVQRDIRQEDKEVTIQLNIPNPQIDGDYSEVSAGCVVYRRDDQGALAFALIEDSHGKWTFPKGKVGADASGDGGQKPSDVASEELQETAERETKEELGLKNIDLQDKLGNITITVRPPGQKWYPKVIHYFLAETKDIKLNPEKSITVKNAAWFNTDDALAKMDYKNSQYIFQKALDILAKQPNEQNSNADYI